MERFTRKVAVVTGSSSGIGKEITKELVKRGVIVAGLARNDKNQQELAGELSKNGDIYTGRFHPIKCDITHEKDIEDAFNNIKKNIGPIAILINNAGFLGPCKTLAELDSQTYQQVFDTNVKGAWLCITKALESMNDDPSIVGHIININSLTGLHGFPEFFPFFTASKDAFRTLSKVLHREVLRKKQNIKVSEIYFGTGYLLPRDTHKAEVLTSSAGLMYTRGSPSMYDGWNETNPGWSFEEVLSYFKKSENNREPKDDIDPGYHGFDGPMRVGYFPYLPDMANNFLAAAEELGIPRTDPNGRHHETFTRAPIMTAHGEMGSPFKMYLRPAMLKPNLHVVTGAHVVRVHFDESGSKAIGVEFRDESNKVRTLKAKKEVILSGGVVGSPQLLQLSGIGLKEDLQKLGIKVIRNLAVGENLHVHFGLTITLRLKGNHRNTINWITVYDFLYNRTGPLTSTGLTQVTAFYASTCAENKVPDIQFYMDGYIPECPTRDHQNREKTVINFRLIYLLTKCRGSIKIKSTNPNDYPRIDPNYLCDGTEVKALLESVEYVRRLVNTTALKEVQPEFDTSENTLCARWSAEKDEKYWTCVLEQYTNGENHHAGTCKMGPKTDPTAVVDNELRVHGISNLRVADASVLPSPINANPIGTILMIGEKVSDMIKRSWGL